ncbi:hypothetical protein AB0M22_25110 [Nocardia sp. NPDC051756]|uniref:hypothetical protein n=1 Tax=Nocardia sp. NPDC051756 TaxID=3154751 RepID=UPI003435AD61
MNPNLDTSPAGLLDISSAPIGFGYYSRNAEDAVAVSRDVDHVGWWSRHRRLTIGVGMMLATALGFVPAVQFAVLLVRS